MTTIQAMYTIVPNRTNLPSVTFGNFGLFSNAFHNKSLNSGMRSFADGVRRYLKGELKQHILIVK